ncbi:MAG: hypothetical protein FJ319_11750 [SAR202 cluster bacterium]|nr:hypothetical protein [SAR202 cluster bacterium]
MSTLETWKTIKVGTGLKTKDDFMRAFEKGGFAITGKAIKMFERAELSVSPAPAVVELVQITTTQLTGEPNGSTKPVVFAAASRMGLKHCTLEIAL